MGKKLTIGIPKGSLQEHTIEIFRAAGFSPQVSDRGYMVPTADSAIQCILLRAQEIPRYVSEGRLDAGITGEDWIKETKSNVQKVADLRYAKHGVNKVKWVLAVPENSSIASARDLKGKTVAAEAVEIAKDYFKLKNIKAKVEFSWGATEIKSPQFADAVIDVTETGDSLRANHLKILDVVFESSTVLIASHGAWKDAWKKEKIKDIGMMLEGAVTGEETVNLIMHTPKRNLSRILKILPSLKHPTVRKITRPNFFDISIVCRKTEVRKLVFRLKVLGCRDIVEFPANLIVP
jgi:ATP phosphoribosyltransferase